MSNVIYFLTAAASNPNSLLTTILLPFLLIFVILWGVLNVMKIFGNEPTGRKINLVVALVITIFAAFTDAWGIVATQLAAFTGVFVYVMFFAVFILGTIFWAIGRTRGVYSEHVSPHWQKDFNNIKDLDNQIAKIRKEWIKAEYKGDVAKMKTLSETLEILGKRRDTLLKQQELRTHGY